MFSDTSSTNKYPKTLIIRNHLGGMIWQTYHIRAKHEAEILSDNAGRNGFKAITLEDYQPESEETFPDWRNTEGGKCITLNTFTKLKTRKD